MPNWTEQQQRAIDLRGGNLLVSAAAGSGKTAVMIERIVSLLAKKETSLDRLLVVTFTIAAASSMKEKLAVRLEEEIGKDPENDYLRDQENLLDHADISTIHAYCARLLKRYYFLTDLPPDFTVPDDAQRELIEEKAMSDVLEDAAKQFEDGLFPAYADVLTQFAGGKSDERLINAVRALAEYRSACPDPDAFREHTLALYGDATCQKWQEYCLSLAYDLLAPVPSYLDEIAAVFRDTPVFESVNKNLSYLYECVSDALACKTLQAMREVLGRKLPTYKRSKNFPALDERFLRCRDKIKKGNKDGLFGVIMSLPDAVDPTYALPAVEGLFRITERYEETCRLAFLEKNCVTFPIILRESLRLLQENPVLLEELRGGLDYLFVDEYQDVNPLLNELVEMLSNKHNLFFVGDVKQSIYGFNDAHPELFTQKLKDYTGVLGTRVDLSNNFRSSKSILDAVNFIFKTYMHEMSENEVEYDEASYLRPSPDTDSAQYKPAILQNGTAEEECELFLCSSDEAEAIACRIDELKNGSIFDAKLGAYRPIEYRDIVLLGRNNAYGNRFTKAFSYHHIPYRVSQSKENDPCDNGTGAVLAFLRLLLLRRDDLSLITVLSSPIGRFTFSELAQIRRVHPDKTFYDAFYAFDGDDALIKKREEFTDLLDRMALLQGSMALPDFLQALCQETGYLYSLACEKDSVKLLNAVERLFASARKYSEQENGSLRGFVSYAEKNANPEESRGESAESDNVVRYMTIHKSKGLEFPIVILVGLDRPIHQKKGKDTFLCDNELGVAFQTYCRDVFGASKEMTSFSWNTVSLKKKLFDKAEGLRLFYVALTRARNKVILTTKRKNLSSCCFVPHRIFSATYESFDELILPLLYCHRDGSLLRQFADNEDTFALYDESRWCVRSEEDENSDAPLTESENAQAEPFDAQSYLSFVENRLAWHYPYAASVTARSKQAPSRSLVHERPDLQRPQFADPVFTGAQKGTVVHFFMEHLDLKSADDARKQAERLRFNGILQEEEFLALPFDAIDAFLSSPLGQRLKNAQVVNRERSFCLIVPLPETGDEALVQGNIDCYFFEGDHIVLLDYKTDVINGNLDVRVDHHTKQMRLYKRALESLYPGKTVEAYLYFFTVSQAIRIE